MKGLIVYASNYGATAQYAAWLGEALGFEVKEVGAARNVASYDAVLIGTNLRQNKLTIAPWVKKQWPKLSGKRLAFFSTSGTPKFSPELQTRYATVFDQEVRAQMPYFPLDGKKLFSDMSWLDRSLMRFIIKRTEKTKPHVAARIGEEFDRLNQDDIKPIVAYIQHHD